MSRGAGDTIQSSVQGKFRHIRGLAFKVVGTVLVCNHGKMTNLYVMLHLDLSPLDDVELRRFFLGSANSGVRRRARRKWRRQSALRS